jgi:hypothetical protein
LSIYTDPMQLCDNSKDHRERGTLVRDYQL